MLHTHKSEFCVHLSFAINPREYIHVCIPHFQDHVLSDCGRVRMPSLVPLEQVRRLIVLIDTLYEHNVKVVILAAAPPQELFDPSGAKSKVQMMTYKEGVMINIG